MEKGQSEAFEDVQLGPLLGQGGFGKVYRGLWNGAAVAVKVGPVMHSFACLLCDARSTCFALSCKANNRLLGLIVCPKF